MKSNFLSKTLVIILMPGFLSQIAHAQKSCDGYYPMQKGTKYQITSYSKDNKEESISDYLIKEYNNNVATVHLVTIKEGKETLNTEYELTCTGEAIIVDLKTLVTKQVAATQKDPNITSDVSGSNPEMPHQLTKGQSLPDNEIDIDIKSSSINLRAKIKQYDIKVEGEESVTVPAGTFDCVIISSKNQTTTLLSKKKKAKLWIARGIGLVKQETYSKSGNLEKTEMLTSFSK